MITTEFSWMTTEELLLHCSNKDNLTSLEQELATRLEAALLEPDQDVNDP